MLHASELFSGLFRAQKDILCHALIAEGGRNQDAVHIDTRNQSKELLQLFRVRILIDRCIGAYPEAFLLRPFDSLNRYLECSAPAGHAVMRFFDSVEMEVEAQAWM